MYVTRSTEPHDPTAVHLCAGRVLVLCVYVSLKCRRLFEREREGQRASKRRPDRPPHTHITQSSSSSSPLTHMPPFPPLIILSPALKTRGGARLRPPKSTDLRHHTHLHRARAAAAATALKTRHTHRQSLINVLLLFPPLHTHTVRGLHHGELWRQHFGRRRVPTRGRQADGH